MPNLTRYTLTFTVPPASAEACKQAIFKAGAGVHYLLDHKRALTNTIAYTNVCFTHDGTGQFLPTETANAVIGNKSVLETVREVKCEVLCYGEEVVRKAVEGLKRTHPYEVPVYNVYKLEDF